MVDTAARPILRQAIRIALARAGLASVVQLVAKSGVSRNTIYGWESGAHMPQFGELSRVAGALDVPIAYLVDAWEGHLWADPQTRESVDASAVEAQVEAVANRVLDRLAAEQGPDIGRAR